MSPPEPPTRAPWPFSKAPAEGEGFPNLPSEAGRALGEQLARLTDIELAKDLPAHPAQLQRCDECAFRSGTTPNGCVETIMDAVKCMLEREPFYCHKVAAADGEPRRLCGGWVAMTCNPEEKE